MPAIELMKRDSERCLKRYGGIDSFRKLSFFAMANAYLHPSHLS